jgi:hypothetical protein
LEKERALLLLSRLFLTVVIIGISIGAIANVVASVYFLKAATSYSSAADAWSGNKSAHANADEVLAKDMQASAASAGSLQRLCESFVLLLLVVAFVFVCVHAFRIIATALKTLFVAKQNLLERNFNAVLLPSLLPQRASYPAVVENLDKASIQGKRMHRKVVVTFVFAFVTLLLRSAFSVFYATALYFQSTFCQDVPFSGCGPCYNAYSKILTWILYTPELQFIIVLIASPLTMLVALWGMSGVREIEKISASESKLRWRWQQLKG